MFGTHGFVTQTIWENMNPGSHCALPTGACGFLALSQVGQLCQKGDPGPFHNCSVEVTYICLMPNSLWKIVHYAFWFQLSRYLYGQKTQIPSGFWQNIFIEASPLEAFRSQVPANWVHIAGILCVSYTCGPAGVGREWGNRRRDVIKTPQFSFNEWEAAWPGVERQALTMENLAWIPVQPFICCVSLD